MKTGTESKLKFKKLQRRLKLPLWQAVGLLETLWRVTERNAPAGDIGRLSNEDIAAAIEWDGDADELVATLVATGWLIRDVHGRLMLSMHKLSWTKILGDKHSRPSMPPGWSSKRLRILERDSYRCQYCGASADTVDHLIPRSKGGDESDTNLVACCGMCNSRKGSQTPGQASMELLA